MDPNQLKLKLHSIAAIAILVVAVIVVAALLVPPQ
jgi:hypothetical protein